MLSMGAQAVGSAVGIPLRGKSESLACHRNTEHQEFHEIAPRRATILVCVQVPYNALCIFL